MNLQRPSVTRAPLASSACTAATSPLPASSCMWPASPCGCQSKQPPRLAVMCLSPCALTMRNHSLPPCAEQNTLAAVGHSPLQKPHLGAAVLALPAVPSAAVLLLRHDAEHGPKPAAAPAAPLRAARPRRRLPSSPAGACSACMTVRRLEHVCDPQLRWIRRRRAHEHAGGGLLSVSPHRPWASGWQFWRSGRVRHRTRAVRFVRFVM